MDEAHTAERIRKHNKKAKNARISEKDLNDANSEMLNENSNNTKVDYNMCMVEEASKKKKKKNKHEKESNNCMKNELESKQEFSCVEDVMSKEHIQEVCDSFAVKKSKKNKKNKKHKKSHSDSEQSQNNINSEVSQNTESRINENQPRCLLNEDEFNIGNVERKRLKKSKHNKTENMSDKCQASVGNNSAFSTCNKVESELQKQSSKDSEYIAMDVNAASERRQKKKKKNKEMPEGCAESSTSTKIKDNDCDLKQNTHNSIQPSSDIRNTSEVNQSEDSKKQKKKKKDKRTLVDTQDVENLESCSGHRADNNGNSNESYNLSSSKLNLQSSKTAEKLSKKSSPACNNVSTVSTVGSNLSETNSSQCTSEKFNLGQWQTATFQASDRQEKFFRLLGGRKSAPSGDCDELPKKRLFSNMAMGQQQQEQMNSSLENQFEKARETSFNLKRGTGLGFSAPPGEGKKFFIDTSKSASKKFDD